MSKAVDGSVISTGEWYHLMGTYNGSVIKLYENGVEVETLNATGSIDTHTPLRIGNSAGTNDATRNWDGQIDDVRIYNYGLTATEVARVYLCSRKGVMDYNTTNHVFEWCGGDDENHVAGTAGAGGGGCAASGSLIAGLEGAMQYDTTNNKMVFCDGASWVNIPN